MKTSERILEAALHLFNEKGTPAVTTHHIAAACGISPGNLYYHYRNKEEIIRALFDQALEMNQQQSQKAQKLSERSCVAVNEGFEFANEYNWRYRFFKRELPLLLRADPLLESKFKIFHQEFIEGMRASLTAAVTDGSLAPLNTLQVGYVAELTWLVALFWSNFIEIGGEQLTRQKMDRGMEIVHWLLTGPLAGPGTGVPGEEKERMP